MCMAQGDGGFTLPDATSRMDYDRCAYACSNPMQYNDPTGHFIATTGGLATAAGPAGGWPRQCVNLFETGL